MAYKYADEGENAEVFEVYDLKNKALLYYEIVYIESAGERRYVKYRLDGEALPNVSK
ncbi:MAG: hypothetical protein HC880_21335 [Bacteroidia bacterium]|nr:hypothetical protein [Bacteroidia bacterium]